MSRKVLVVVEGPTELSVLNSTLGVHLGGFGVYLYPKIVGKPGHKGGVHRKFDGVAKEIVNLFKQEPNVVVTTFFDFYAMPEDWPGVAKAKESKITGLTTIEIARIVEREWQIAVADKAREIGRPIAFIPYVQMYELEALLFASPKHMAEGFLQPKLQTEFEKIVLECGGCEEINDRPQYAPSKRIQNLFPGYRKGRDKNKTEERRPHAPVIAGRIGVEALRRACPHFGEWLTLLERLGEPPV
jgi:hypothetical protein